MSYHLSDIVDKKDEAWRRPPICRHAACKVIGSSLFRYKAKNGGFDFSKPPFQMGVLIGLLHDGFFSFAVVRQLFTC